MSNVLSNTFALPAAAQAIIERAYAEAEFTGIVYAPLSADDLEALDAEVYSFVMGH